MLCRPAQPCPADVSLAQGAEPLGPARMNLQFEDQPLSDLCHVKDTLVLLLTLVTAMGLVTAG